MEKSRAFVTILILLGIVAACGSPERDGPGRVLPAAPTSPPAAAAPAATATSLPARAVPTVASPTGTAPATLNVPVSATFAPAAPGVPPTLAASGAGGLRPPEQAALEAAGGEKIGGSVSVLAVWEGSEQATFLSIVEPFERATGIRVQYEGTRNINAVLTTRVRAGQAPDVAGLPGPGQMREFARGGDLIDLAGVLGSGEFGSHYDQTWADLGTVDGKLAGIFLKATVKGLIWYDPKVWQQHNWQPPQTWVQLMALSQKMAATGVAPWCEALENEAASGWPGTDWLEDIVLRQAGIDVYNRWWQGGLEWSSPEIKKAWQTWGQIVADPAMVRGSASTMLTAGFDTVGDPLFTSPPGCYMAHQATFITDFFLEHTPGIKPIDDFNFFPFPSFADQPQDSTVVGGDLFGMFHDTPQARALIRYLITPEAQSIWVRAGGAISTNQAVPLSLYPDELSRKAAERLTGVTILAFDASDMMPDAMNQAFWQAILDYVQHPEDLDTILQELDSVRLDAYANGK